MCHVPYWYQKVHFELVRCYTFLVTGLVIAECYLYHVLVLSKWNHEWVMLDLFHTHHWKNMPALNDCCCMKLSFQCPNHNLQYLFLFQGHALAQWKAAFCISFCDRLRAGLYIWKTGRENKSKRPNWSVDVWRGLRQVEWTHWKAPTMTHCSSDMHVCWLEGL